MRKKFLQLIFPLILLSVITVFFTACTQKPWDYDNVVWYADEPKIEITNTVDTHWIGTLKTDNYEISIQLLWGPTGSFEVIDYSLSNQETSVEDITLLSGRVNYDKYTATLIIEKDYVFNKKYGSIILQRRNLE